MNRITATLGILTYNSEATLSRCLESAKGFAEIVIADGGSTDLTCEIAARYGARVIAQSNPGHPIVDFALERNRLLEAATMPWFFYLDADEVVTPQLLSVLTSVTNNPHADGAYRVCYRKTNADLTKVYRTFKDYYQIRLVQTGKGARFERRVHERLRIPEGMRVGQIDAPWYVPLDADDLSLPIFAKKAWTRIGIQANAWKPKGIGDAVMRALITPVLEILKSLVKIVVVPLRWGTRAIPLQYELLRILYSVFVIVRHSGRLLSLPFSKQ